MPRDNDRRLSGIWRKEEILQEFKSDESLEIPRGPIAKNEATKQFELLVEDLIQARLDEGSSKPDSVTLDKKMVNGKRYVRTPRGIYDLVFILQNLDPRTITLSDEVKDNYVECFNNQWIDLDAKFKDETQIDKGSKALGEEDEEAQRHCLYPDEEVFRTLAKGTAIEDLHFGEMLAINNYSGGQYTAYNSLLRANEATLKGDISLDTLCNIAMANSGLNQLPNTEFEPNHQTFRYDTSDLPEEVVKSRIESAESPDQDKKIVKESAFISTSEAVYFGEIKEGEPLAQHRTLFTGVIGKHIAPISQKPLERELLMPGTDVVYVDHKEENGTHYYYAKPVYTPRAVEKVEPLFTGKDEKVADASQEREQNQQSNQALKYVFELLNQPFPNEMEPLSGKSYKSLSPKNWQKEIVDYIEEEQIVHRPEHNGVRALQMAFLLPVVANAYLSSMSSKQIDSSEEFLRILSNPLEIQRMQVALLFSDVGRKNGVHIGDNPELHAAFKRASAQAFYDYAKEHLQALFPTEELLEQYQSYIADFEKPQRDEPHCVLMRHCAGLQLNRTDRSLEYTDHHKLSEDLTEDNLQRVQTFFRAIQMAVGEDAKSYDDEALFYDNYLFAHYCRDRMLSVSAPQFTVSPDIIAKMDDLQKNVAAQPAEATKARKGRSKALTFGSEEESGKIYSDQLKKAIHNGNAEKAIDLLSDPKKVKRMLQVGADPLRLAIEHNQLDIAKYIVEQNIQDLNKTDQAVSPLWRACKEGNLQMIDLLIKAGAKVDFEAKNGNTPLHIACIHGHPLAVRALIDAGADPNVKNKERKTPIDIAFEKRDMKTFKEIAGFENVNLQEVKTKLSDKSTSDGVKYLRALNSAQRHQKAPSKTTGLKEVKHSHTNK